MKVLTQDVHFWSNNEFWWFHNHQNHQNCITNSNFSVKIKFTAYLGQHVHLILDHFKLFSHKSHCRSCYLIFHCWKSLIDLIKNCVLIFQLILIYQQVLLHLFRFFSKPVNWFSILYSHRRLIRNTIFAVLDLGLTLLGSYYQTLSWRSPVVSHALFSRVLKWEDLELTQ